ncbi:hypothetical protein [Rubinisphaera italica]|uniref:Uncharacterized protein n=1 Tax=Rubinisphaera italica TaxID=2527969 RepID=A0A5C5XP51_9PLAN|nr:hypothetical protein [Rubinisphaera italica]TWT64231.1 hypothetical protein Pan54_49920 [Rubinisphaera italica]
MNTKTKVEIRSFQDLMESAKEQEIRYEKHNLNQLEDIITNELTELLGIPYREAKGVAESGIFQWYKKNFHNES